MLGSVETQRNGICTVFYGVDGKVKNQVRDFQFPRARFINTVGRCFTSVPMRVNSVHFVYNDSRLRPFMFLFQYALGRVIRARFQTHHGKRLFVVYLASKVYSFIYQCGSNFSLFVARYSNGMQLGTCVVRYTSLGISSRRRLLHHIHQASEIVESLPQTRIRTS